jgi:hypothetical protein
MYRKAPLPSLADPFTRQPNKLPLFAYRKTFSQNPLVPDVNSMNLIPILDIRLQSSLSLDLQRFIDESERRMQESLIAALNEDIRYSTTSEPIEFPALPVREDTGRPGAGPRNQSGGNRIALARGDWIAPSEQTILALDHLVDAVKRSLGKEIVFVGTVPITRKALAGIPLLMFSSDTRYLFSEDEDEALVQYLLDGGFVWVDGDSTKGTGLGFESAVAKMSDSAHELSLSTGPLPDSHPLVMDTDYALEGDSSVQADHIIGIWIDTRLAGVISDRPLSALSGAPENDIGLAFGVNLVSYVLSLP